MLRSSSGVTTSSGEAVELWARARSIRASTCPVSEAASSRFTWNSATNGNAGSNIARCFSWSRRLVVSRLQSRYEGLPHA
jgi:hypothetical protein